MGITPLPTPPSRSDAANFSVRADAFLGAFPTLVTEINAVATAIDADATAAAAAAATAVASPNTNATSTTSLTISVASKTLTIQTGKTLTADMWVAIVKTGDPSSWMVGQVVLYNSGTGQLIVDVQRVAGSGTAATWRVYGTTPMLSDSAPRALAAGSTVKDATGVDRALGFLDSPTIAVNTSHVLTQADNGKTIELGASGSITIPLHATTDMGSAIVLIRNMDAATKTITPASGVTLHWSGSTTTGARTLKGWGDAAISFTSVNDDVRVKGDLT